MLIQQKFDNIHRWYCSICYLLKAQGYLLLNGKIRNFLSDWEIFVRKLTIKSKFWLDWRILEREVLSISFSTKNIPWLFCGNFQNQEWTKVWGLIFAIQRVSRHSVDLGISEISNLVAYVDARGLTSRFNDRYLDESQGCWMPRNQGKVARKMSIHRRRRLFRGF